MRQSVNTVLGDADQASSKPQGWHARLAGSLDYFQTIDLPKYLHSRFEGILLITVGIVLLAHAFTALSALSPIFFFLVFGLIVFNIICPTLESRLKKAIDCPFFPSIIVNVLLISALMHAAADSFPSLSLNLSLAYLFLSTAAALSLKPRQTLTLSISILLLFGFYLLKTDTFFQSLSYLLFFSLLLTALTLFPTLSTSRFSKQSLNARILDSTLTEREKQLMAFLAEGKANKEIAFSLDISEKTVRNSLSSVYRKLDVGSRQEAILRFM